MLWRRQWRAERLGRGRSHYDSVPKGLVENLKFRRDVVRECVKDRALAEEIWIVSRREPLFWVNTFAWTFDPRAVDEGRDPVIPFITWDFQDEVLDEGFAAVGKRDMCFQKSRDMGFSWLMCLIAMHQAQFMDMRTFLFVSRNEELVDKKEDPDCLFWKLEWLLKQQPKFLRPRYSRTERHIKIEDTQSTIDGVATTGNIGRGGRRTAVFIDEFAAFPRDDGYAALAATQSTTRCRFFNSTPQGTGNAYYDVAHTKGIKTVSCHWSKHPHKKPGLYTSQNGQLVLLDPGYKYPNGYQFVLDGKLRSPWYDEECKRAPIPQIIAQELDMDFLASDFQFFDGLAIGKHAERFGRPPAHVGELLFDPHSTDTLRFEEQNGGRLSLWEDIAPDGTPGDGMSHYTVGCDISYGVEASESVIYVVNASTMNGVAEFASNDISITGLAKLAVGICKWFGNAFMIWEANGPGRTFGKEVMDLGYTSIYYRKDEHTTKKKVTNVPGWWSTKDNKAVLLGDYKKNIEPGLWVNPSRQSVMQCAEYVFTKAGTIEYSKSLTAIDPRSHGENHGDRVIAAALAFKAAAERGTGEYRELARVIPDASVAARDERQRMALAAAKNEDAWLDN